MSSLAERLIALADGIKHPKSQVIQAVDMDDYRMSRCVLALRFSKLPKGEQLKAMLDGWDIERTVKELW